MIERDWGKERLDIGKRIISFVGPEGSGKTTQALLLSGMSKKPYLTTGDTLRDYAKNDTGRYGEACRKMFSEHTYLDGNLLLEIMSERFSKDDTIDGFIFDGGFRTVEETEKFEQTLINSGRLLPVVVIKINIPREVSFERLVTGENARKRKDDTDDALDCRLKKYYDRLDERMAIIKSNPSWKVIEIDGTGNQEETLQQILSKLTA